MYRQVVIAILADLALHTGYAHALIHVIRCSRSRDLRLEHARDSSFL